MYYLGLGYALGLGILGVYVALSLRRLQRP